VHARGDGGPLGVVAAAEAVNTPAGVDTQERADYLIGYYLAVVHSAGSDPARTQPPPAGHRLLHELPNQAIGGYNEGIRAHGCRPLSSGLVAFDSRRTRGTGPETCTPG
jgi:hypothetical protein